MAVVISRSVVLGGAGQGGNDPLIGWHNVLMLDQIVATSANPLHPASNLANPSTRLRWESAAGGTQFLTFSINYDDPVDYIGVARHNWHSTSTFVSVEIFDGDTWEEVIDAFVPGDDSPLILRFDPRIVSGIRIRLETSDAARLRAAVVYIGRLLVMQRRIYVGHTPLHMARDTAIANTQSESANFLGRVVTARRNASVANFKNLTPGWYRRYMEPFVVQTEEVPFFFAWRPETYPLEVGYAWTKGTPNPVNELPNGMMSVSIEYGGIVR